MMKFREVAAEDIGQLKNLVLISYGQFQKTLTMESWNHLRAHLTKENLFPDLLKISTGFVCEHDNEIIGMAFLVPKENPTEIFQAGWSYIRLVGVHPNHWGNGIGKQLITMCLDLARRTKENTVVLHTSEFMDAARHIYESLGFKKFKELDPRYGKKYWIYHLEL